MYNNVGGHPAERARVQFRCAALELRAGVPARAGSLPSPPALLNNAGRDNQQDKN